MTVCHRGGSASVATCKPAIGGHFKTGQRSGPRTRVFIPCKGVCCKLFFRDLIPPGLYWRDLDGGYGNAGMRPERRSRAGMAGGASRPVPCPFWRGSDKSREREGSALAVSKAYFLTMRVRFW